MFIESPLRYPLSRTDQFERMCVKARVATALQALQGFVGKVPAYVSPYHEEGVALKFQIRPSKKVTVETNILSKLPLVLLPMTANISLISPQQSFFVKTSYAIGPEGSREVVALGPVFVDPVNASPQKPGVVEFFLDCPTL
ncbi:MAG: hypothetical protein AAGJ35_12160 [Myxococcota bacterium]